MAQKTGTRNKSSTNAKNNSSETPTGESLDQVRDILFGGQMRAVESRLERLESRIMREVEHARTEASDRMDGLESAMQVEVASLSDKLQAEQSRRADDLKALAADLKSAVKDFEKRLGTLDNATSKADAELRDQILQNASAATTQLKQRTDEVRQDLERQAQELRTEKVDTAALIGLFSEMALRLTDEIPSETDA